MKSWALLVVGVVLLGVFIFRLAMRTSRPPKEPTPVTPELLLRRRRGFLLGLLAWLTAFFAGGSLILYGILTGPPPPFKLFPIPAPWYIAGAGVVILLAGRVWYSITLFQIIRPLWTALCGPEKRRDGSIWIWIALVPVIGGTAVLTLWLAAPRRQRWLHGCWGILGGGLLGAGLVFFFALPWWLWLALYGWIAVTLFRLSSMAIVPEAARSKDAPGRRFLFACIVLGLISLAAGFGWLWMDHVVNRTVREAERRIGERGVLPTPEAMNARNPTPENNAWPQYQEIEAAWRSVPASPRNQFNLTSFADLGAMPRLTPEVEAELTAWLTTQEPVTRLLDRLDPEQPMQFPHDWRLALSDEYPELGVVKKLADCQYLRLDLARRTGNTEKMWQLWQQLRTLQRWIRDDDTMLAGLINVEIGSRKRRCAEAMLNAAQFSDAELTTLMRQMETDETALYAAWRRNFIGDAFRFGAIQTRGTIPERPPLPARTPGDQLAMSAPVTALTMGWVMPLNRALSQDIFSALIDLTAPEARPVVADVDVLLNSLETEPTCQLLPQMFFPAMLQIARQNFQEVANLRVMHTAIAAELYRRKYGSWPERLTDLVPEFLDAVPVDPFDGQPLRIRRGELNAVELDLKPVAAAETQVAAGFDPGEVVDFSAPQPISGQKFTREYHQVTRPGFRVYSVGLNQRGDGSSVGRDSDISFTWYDPPKEESL